MKLHTFKTEYSEYSLTLYVLVIIFHCRGEALVHWYRNSKWNERSRACGVLALFRRYPRETWRKGKTSDRRVRLPTFGHDETNKPCYLVSRLHIVFMILEQGNIRAIKKMEFEILFTFQIKHFVRGHQCSSKFR